MSTYPIPADLAAAAKVHAAREEIVQALGPLAARPLDEQAAAQMRTALERAQSPEVRDAVRQLGRPEGPRPSLVTVGSHTPSKGRRTTSSSTPSPAPRGAE